VGYSAKAAGGDEDEKAFAARLDDMDSLCVHRDGDGDRPLLLAVLDGRVQRRPLEAGAEGEREIGTFRWTEISSIASVST
jgi:hypothetical protein